MIFFTQRPYLHHLRLPAALFPALARRTAGFAPAPAAMAAAKEVGTADSATKCVLGGATGGFSPPNRHVSGNETVRFAARNGTFRNALDAKRLRKGMENRGLLHWLTLPDCAIRMWRPCPSAQWDMGEQWLTRMQFHTICLVKNVKKLGGYVFFNYLCSSSKPRPTPGKPASGMAELQKQVSTN